MFLVASILFKFMKLLSDRLGVQAKLHYQYIMSKLLTYLSIVSHYDIINVKACYSFTLKLLDGIKWNLQ